MPFRQPRRCQGPNSGRFMRFFCIESFFVDLAVAARWMRVRSLGWCSGTDVCALFSLWNASLCANLFAKRGVARVFQIGLSPTRGTPKKLCGSLWFSLAREGCPHERPFRSGDRTDVQLRIQASESLLGPFLLTFFRQAQCLSVALIGQQFGSWAPLHLDDGFSGR